MQEADETDAKAERLEKLAAFQLQMILHAYKCEFTTSRLPRLVIRYADGSPVAEAYRLLHVLRPR